MNLTWRLLGSQEFQPDTASLHYLGDRVRNVEQVPAIPLIYGFPSLQVACVFELTGEAVTVASICECA